MVVGGPHGRLPVNSQALHWGRGTAGLHLPVVRVGGGGHEGRFLSRARDEFPLDVPPPVAGHGEIEVSLLAFGAPEAEPESGREQSISLLYLGERRIPSFSVRFIFSIATTCNHVSLFREARPKCATQRTYHHQPVIVIARATTTSDDSLQLQ